MKHDFDIKVFDNPDFKGIKKVKSSELQSDPKSVLQFVKDGYQVHLYNSDDELVMVMGGNGPLRIEVTPSLEMLELQKEIEIDSASTIATPSSWLD